MKRFESVVVVGSSGSGKTTLVDGLREEQYDDKLVIPRRYITRPERLGDNKVENSHITSEEFERLVLERSINPYWSRILDGGRQERYGFDALNEGDKRLRVYSANNAFLRDLNPTVTEVLDSSLVIVAMATAESRDQRLEVRSPDMSDAERAVRLSDAGVDVLAANVEIEVIDTTDFSPTEGQLAIQGIIGKLL